MSNLSNFKFRIIKINLCLLFLIFSYNIIYTNVPSIKWWFDTKDASAGQSAAGDVDSDGFYELSFGCYRNDNHIYVLNSNDGTLHWKYDTKGCNDVATLIFDVDNDGKLDIVLPSSCNNSTFCFEGKDGTVKWQEKTRGSDSPPTIADIDGDGKLEILHGEFTGWVRCLDAETGKTKWDLLIDSETWIQTAPTIIDVDNDGQLDFIVATWNLNKEGKNRLFAINGKTREIIWEYEVNDVIYHGTAVADLDKDGLNELIIGDYSGELFVLNAKDGTLKWSYILPEYYAISGPVAIGDLNGDGNLEIVFSGWFKMIALNNDGSLLWEYEIPSYSSCFRGVALSDIDNDKLPDVIFGTQKGMLIALKGNKGDTLWTMDLAEHYGKEFDVNHAPIVADFDKDGIMDVFVVGGHMEYPEIQNNYGRAYCISAGKGAGPDWLMFQNNEWRNSNPSMIPSNLDEIMNNDNSKISVNYNYYDNLHKSIEINVMFPDFYSIKIYDINGKFLQEINNDYLEIGTHIFDLEMENKFVNINSAVYFVKISNNYDVNLLKKIALIR